MHLIAPLPRQHCLSCVGFAAGEQGHARCLQLWLTLTTQEIEVLSVGLTQTSDQIMCARNAPRHAVRWLQQQQADLKMQVTDAGLHDAVSHVPHGRYMYECVCVLQRVMSV
jgi:hypothetical protein